MGVQAEGTQSYPMNLAIKQDSSLGDRNIERKIIPGRLPSGMKVRG